MAEKDLNSTDMGNVSPIVGGNTTSLSGDEMSTRLQSKNELSSENTDIKTEKVPNTDVIFAEGINTVSSANIANETPISANIPQATPNYQSLSDIIQAKDWKALGEYKCKIKAENAEKFDDKVAAIEAQESSWTSRFTSPFTAADTSSCCG